MIDNRLRKCCEHCGDIDLECKTEQIAVRNVLGGLSKEIWSFISCKHYRVCKRYIESQGPEE